jgi:hypothetical protein
MVVKPSSLVHSNACTQTVATFNPIDARNIALYTVPKRRCYIASRHPAGKIKVAVYKMSMATSKTHLILITALLLSLFSLLACDSGESTVFTEEDAGFGIYLLDTGELVLSEDHVRAYYQDSHTIELNEEGIMKWNSYQTYTAEPKLKDTLFSRDFVLKIGEKEIYRGKFYSTVSSMSYDGVVIIDALFELDDEHNTIQIEFGYPWSHSNTEGDPRNSPEVISFFEGRGLLE